MANAKKKKAYKEAIHNTAYAVLHAHELIVLERDYGFDIAKMIVRIPDKTMCKSQTHPLHEFEKDLLEYMKKYYPGLLRMYYIVPIHSTREDVLIKMVIGAKPTPPPPTS